MSIYLLLILRHFPGDIQVGKENTAQLLAQKPTGERPTYEASTIGINAEDLLKALKPFEGQHALYLSAIPLIKGALPEGATQSAATGKCAGNLGNIGETTPAHERVEKYLRRCGEGFGMGSEGIDRWKSGVV